MERFQRPLVLLILMSIAMPLAFNVWNAMLNNFVVERANFGGVEIGILQSLREVPGFLAFTTVFVLLILKEQSFAVLSLALLGLGVALTGFFPSEYGLYFTTVLMSWALDRSAIRTASSVSTTTRFSTPSPTTSLCSLRR